MANVYRQILGDNFDRWTERHLENAYRQAIEADMQGLESPWLDPVDTLTGGLMALPRGAVNVLADMVADVGLGAVMEGYTGDAAPAIFAGKKGLQKLGVNPERDLVGQFSGLWDKGVRAELDDTGGRYVGRAGEIFDQKLPGNYAEGDVRDFYKTQTLDVPGYLDADAFVSYTPREGRRSGTFLPPSGGRRAKVAVTADSDDFAAQTMPHELQHAIQEREGFARGGSPGQFQYDEGFYPSATELDQAKDLLRWSQQYGRTVDDIAESMDYATPRAQHLARNPELLQEAQQVFDLARRPEQSYRRLAGEWEARNSGTRAVLPGDDPRLGNALQFNDTTFRTGNPFSTADDIPLQDLIIRMDR